jgi:hypothetical protein
VTRTPASTKRTNRVAPKNHTSKLLNTYTIIRIVKSFLVSHPGHENTFRNLPGTRTLSIFSSSPFVTSEKLQFYLMNNFIPFQGENFHKVSVRLCA